MSTTSSTASVPLLPALLTLLLGSLILVIGARVTYTLYLRRHYRRLGNCTCTCALCGRTRDAGRRDGWVPLEGGRDRGGLVMSLAPPAYAAGSGSVGASRDGEQQPPPPPPPYAAIASVGGSGDGEGESVGASSSRVEEREEEVELRERGDERERERDRGPPSTRLEGEECCWVEGEAGHCGVGWRRSGRWWRVLERGKGNPGGGDAERRWLVAK